MKKVSTVRAEQSRNISQQKLTIGLDLGDRNSWYCVMDEAGRIQLEQRVRTTAKELREVFGALPRSRIALEIGTHSPWISRLLRQWRHEVIVANARQVKLITQSSRKNDKLDAQTLARLARVDPQLLKPIRHRSEEAQQHLMVIRVRAALVEARTALINTARGLAKAAGERLPKCDADTLEVARLEALPVGIQAVLKPLLEEAEWLRQRSTAVTNKSSRSPGRSIRKPNS
jgi:transposase